MLARWTLLAWLPVIFVAAAVTAAETPSESPSNVPASQPQANRSISALQNDVQAAMRAEAISRRQGANAAEVVRLVELFRELAAHPKRDESPSIRDLGLKLRSRLKEVAAQIERRTSDRARVAKKQPLAPASVAGPQTQVLAQQVAAPLPAPAQPGQPAANQPGQAGQVLDYGPQLVELIQATISPESWNINGGLSSIVYYAPLRVLVISAPQSVHGEIGGALGQLR